MKRIPAPLLFAALAALALPARALPGPAGATYNWGAQLTVAGYDSDKAALADFPVLVRVSTNAVPGFRYSQLVDAEAGSDLCFVGMDGAGLPFEIDTWNTNSESLVWVRLPSMEQGASFVMCWGSASSGKAVCADNPFAGYKGVWHMNETNAVDASGSGNGGTAAGAVALAAGAVGSGLSYPDKNSFVSCGANQPNSELASGFTIEGWANQANYSSGNQALFGKNLFMSVRTEGATTLRITTPGIKDHDTFNPGLPAAGTWYHWAMSFVPGTGGLQFYVNGANVRSAWASNLGNQDKSGEMWIARNQWGSGQGFQGLVDEYRLSASVRSADWIAATYASQADPTFLTAGPATPYEATPEPQIGLAAPQAAVLYTNATLSANVGSLGTDAAMADDASWVDPLLVVSENADFSDPLFVLPLSRVESAPASVAVPLVPLATNTTYYARLSATNSFGVAGGPAEISFTTRAPGAPAGTGAFLSGGPARLSATGAVTDFGIGASSATIRLEASADGFATIVASAETNAVPGQAATFAVENLEPNTDYALRFRLVNDWGLVTYVQLSETHATRSALAALYAFDRSNPFESVVGSPAKEGTIPLQNAAANLSATISALSAVSELDGRTGVVSVPPGSTLAIPNPGLQKDWTIALWFYAPAAADRHCFFQFTPANGADGSLFLKDGSQIGAGNGFTALTNGVGETVSAVGAWHQLVVSSANNKQTVWFDRQKLDQTRSWDIAGMSLLQFSLDNDGEDATLCFDEIRLYDETAPGDLFPEGTAAGPVLLDRWSEAPYVDDWGSFSRAPDRVVDSFPPYRAYVFSRHGTVAFTPHKASPGSSLLLAGGGGAGGMTRGGGGGAGGVVAATGVELGAQSYVFTVGAGGVPDVHRSWYLDKQWGDLLLHEGATTASTCGGETTFGTMAGATLHTAPGGGGGGNFNWGTGGIGDLPAEAYGLDGASGGGAAGRSVQPGLGTAGLGHDGGKADTESDGCGGGGGGAGGPGADGTSAVAGAGGPGVTNSITGLPVVYGGGGGAASYDRAAGGVAGVGGGGTGVSCSGGRRRSTAANGLDGLGGGGGGGAGWANTPYSTTGGRGGDGTVVLRVLVPEGGDPEPTVSVAASGIGYTNATFDVRLLSLGAGASSASVVFRLSANADMSSPLLETNLAAEATSVPASFAPAWAPLATNGLYYAQATAVNDNGETGVSALVSFRTLDPEPAAVGLTPAGVGFGTVSATANLASFGAGSTDATVYLDCSLLGDFSDAVSSAGVAVSSLPFTQVLTTAGLVPGSNYFYRVRAVNTWGVEGVSATFEAVTEPAPVRLSKIGSTPAADGSQRLSVSTLAVEAGTTYALTISIDGATVRTFVDQTSTRTFEVSFSGAPNSTHVVVATASAVYLGRTYTTTERLAFALGGNNVIVTDWSAHCSAATAIRIHAGDTVVLPSLLSGWRYRVLNERFLAMDGLEVTALEPAVAGIEVWNGDNLMDTIAILVLPEAIEGGDVYVYREDSSTKDLWMRASTWEKLGSAENDSWPSRAGDVAVVPFYATEGTFYLRHESDFAVGGILFGNFRDATSELVLERTKAAGATKTVTFERGDGEPAFVKVTPNTGAERSTKLRFGGYAIVLECASSVETDSCSSPTNSAILRGYVTYESCTVDIPEGKYWSVDGLPGFDLNMTGTVGPPNLTGEGTFWKKGMGGITFSWAARAFRGTLLDTSHGAMWSFNRSGPIFWKAGVGTNISVTVAGWCWPQLGIPSGASLRARGWFRTGWEHGYGEADVHKDGNGNCIPWTPRRTMTMRGGVYTSYASANEGWGVGVRDTRLFEKLVVGPGFSRVIVRNASNASGCPINCVEWDGLGHEDKGTFVVYDPSRLQAGPSATTNTTTIVKNHDSFLVGAGADGDCLVRDVYPIIPWMVAPASAHDSWWDRDSNWRETLFVSFDADGLLVHPVFNDTALDGAASPFSNAYVWNRAIGIERDVTVNSLYLNDGGKDRWLGAGRTLTITSGGLVLQGENSAIGQPGRADNGALVLGDADHPGYVFAKSSNLEKPNQIWADVTAPGGFVSSWSGALVLGGSQTNIADELVVNAGVLQLGTDGSGCALARNLPVRVCCGAKLVVPRADAVKKCFLRFDGADGEFGRVELPDGVAAQCKKAFWRDWPKTPDWQPLPRGTYGSSDSGVAGEFVRDDLFSGTGTLRVVSDDRIDPSLLILR